MKLAKLKVFTVRDDKTESFSAPMFLDHAGQALRMIEDLVNDGKSNLSKYPKDFTLYEIGLWDSVTNEWDIYQTPKLLGQASEYKRELKAV